MKDKIRSATRRILGVLAAFVLALGIVGANAVPVMAAELSTGTEDSDKTITIESPSGLGASDSITYTVYKIFNATTNGTNVSYTVPSSGTSYTLPIEASDKLSKFDKDASENVHYYSRTSTSGEYTIDTTTADLSSSMITTLGTLTSSFANVGTIAITGPSTKKTATVSDYGYYYITSTVGSAVSVDSTHPSVTLTDKNEVPTVDKNITGVTGQTITSPTKSATADIGDYVTYTATITAPADTSSLYFHDQLGSGLTLVTNEVESIQPFSITYTVGSSGTETPMTASNAGTISAINYTENLFSSTAATSADSDKNITVGDNIVLKFNGTFTDETTINITYRAIVNENAVIGNPGNLNDASIDYGNKYSSSVSTKATVYTYDLDLVKTGETTTVITGAKFKLYKGTAGTGDTVTKTDGDSAEAIQFIKTSGSSTSPTTNYDTYRVALPSEISDSNVTKTTEIEAGYIRFVGLENGVYALEETEAPSGYHKLTDLVKITVSGANSEATVTSTTSDGKTTLTYSSGGVRVQNTEGTELPSTGGIGTTIFYVIGGILVAGAVVLLVVRRRRNA